MRTECICVSTNHDDFLDVVIPFNKQFFDEYYIITKETDTATIKVCEKYGLKPYFSNLFHKNGAKFNRGAIYNEYFQKLKHKEWIILLDSDIILPSEFKIFVPFMNVECFYGWRRLDVPDRNTLQNVIVGKTKISDLLAFRGFGYGYGQVFHYQSFTFKSLLPYPYPETNDTGECDWMFRNFWGDIIYNPPLTAENPHLIKSDDYSNGLLKELPYQVLHLGKPGINSAERKTERF